MKLGQLEGNQAWHGQKMLRLVAILLAVGCFFYQVFTIRNQPTKHYRNLVATASRISAQTVRNITVRLLPWGDTRPVTLDESSRAEFADLIGKMKPAPYSSYSHGNWENYGGMVIDDENGQYAIAFGKRGGGPTIAQFQIKGKPASYTFYLDAEELWPRLKRVPAVAERDTAQ